MHSYAMYLVGNVIVHVQESWDGLLLTVWWYTCFWIVLCHGLSQMFGHLSHYYAGVSA